MNLSEVGRTIKGNLLEGKLLAQGSRAFTPREVRQATTREQKKAARREIVQRTLARDLDSVEHVPLVARDGITLITDPEADRTPLVTTENVAEGMYRGNRPADLVSHLPAAERERIEERRNAAQASLPYVGFDKNRKGFLYRTSVHPWSKITKEDFMAADPQWDETE